jgi:hypothetical protein
MTTCTEKHHPNHPHKHGPDCGHTAIRHDGHIDYLHDGHLHHMHGDHVDEHVIDVSAKNPVPAHLKSVARISTVQTAGTKPYRVATMSITS